MLLLGLNFLPKPLQANACPLCCQILCWLSICRDLKALLQPLHGWILSLLCFVPPTLIQSSNNMISLTNQPSTPAGPGAWRWEPSLNLILILGGDVADAYRCLDRPFFLELLATVVALFWQTGKVGEWQVIWCLKRPQMIHDIGSLCISTMLLFNFCLVKSTIKQELQVKETQGKTDRGEFNQHALLHHKALLHYILPQLLLHLLLIINILLLLLLILLLFLLFKEI